MDSLSRPLRLLGVILLLIPVWAFSHETAEIFARQGLSQDFCSSINTASISANLSDWQSLGLCSEYCISGNYAFAVMQWQSCWCSDVAPGASITTDLSRCSEGCPGYPKEENCGRRPNLFGYMRLQKQPVSTQGASTSSTRESTTSTRAPSPPPAVTETVQNTITVRPSPSPSPSPSSTPTTESSPSTGQEQTTPQVSQTTVTADGVVRTVFITPTSEPETTEASNSGVAADEANMGSSGSSGLATGAVVGIVVGVIAAVLAFAGAILFWFFRRRKQQNSGTYNEPGSSQRGSSSGMISSTRNPEMVVTSDNGSTWVPNPDSEQRRSRLMAVDPRMDPNGRPMFMRNKSHESVNTIHDDQDYSRKVARPVLRATNPDPSHDE